MKRKSKIMAFSLQHQISFLKNINNSPFEPERWQEKLKTFAEIIPISESSYTMLENLNFGHVITEGYYLFKIRFIKDIDTNLRISFKNKNFEVKRVINLKEQDRVLQIIAMEI